MQPSRVKTRAARGDPALVLAFLVCVASLTAALAPVAFSAPRYPEAKGNVNDFVGVLSRDDKANLEALASAVLDQTGTTIAVAIVNDHGDESLLMYAVHLYERWGIGKKGEDKGLLVVVSMEDHDLRAEVGYGLEHIITDARAGDCLDEMTPYFQNGEYGKGLYAGLLRAAGDIAKAEGVDLKIKAATRDYEDFHRPLTGIPWLLAPILLAPLVLLSLFAIRGKRCPRCKSRLSSIDRVVQKATYNIGGIAMRVYRCPRCGYHNERVYKTSPVKRPFAGGFPMGPGPFFGGGQGPRGRIGGGASTPRGFGGGRSGGGGASRKW